MHIKKEVIKKQSTKALWFLFIYCSVFEMTMTTEVNKHVHSSVCAKLH